MNIKINEVNVVVGDGVVVVTRSGSSGKAVAHILGTQSDDAGEHIYLDRLIHTPFENKIGEYRVSGAISSILTKQHKQ